MTTTVHPPATDRPHHAPARLAGTARAWLMIGISYVIPLIATGGLLVAAGYALGGQAVRQAPPVSTDFAWTAAASWAALAFQLGTLAFTLVVPAVGGAVGYAVGDRLALIPGVLGGSAALGVGAGYLGGIAAGLLAGGAVRLAERWTPPPALRTAWYVVLLPLLSTLFTGAVLLLALGGPLAALGAGLSAGLTALSGADALLVGLVVGVLVSIDLGGPANKAVYAFAVAGLAAGAPAAPATMAAVLVAGMVPPLALALASTVRRELFTEGERAAGRSAWVTGAMFVTEGAIPFAAADPLRVIPSVVAGSAVGGGLAMVWGVTVAAPHGGLLVLPLVGHPLAFLGALAAGIAVAAGAVILLKSRVAARPGSRLGEPDPAEAG